MIRSVTRIICLGMLSLLLTGCLRNLDATVAPTPVGVSLQVTPVAPTIQPTEVQTLEATTPPEASPTEVLPTATEVIPTLQPTLATVEATAVITEVATLANIPPTAQISTATLMPIVPTIVPTTAVPLATLVQPTVATVQTINPLLSTVCAVAPATLRANFVDLTVVTVTVVDTNSAPMSNASVTLNLTQTPATMGAATIGGPNPQSTDPSGRAQFNVASSNPGIVNFTATVNGVIFGPSPCGSTATYAAINNVTATATVSVTPLPGAQSAPFATWTPFPTIPTNSPTPSATATATATLTSTPTLTETPTATFTPSVTPTVVTATISPTTDGAEGILDADCSYHVEQDDRLLRIGLRFNRTLAQLQSANPAILNTNVIYLGQVLKIPNCHTP